MHIYKIEDNRHRYTRISKALARVYYNESKPGEAKFCLCPCKLRPGYPWSPHMKAYKKDEQDFDKLVSNFEWYNCSYEAGYYAAFYRVENK